MPHQTVTLTAGQYTSLRGDHLVETVVVPNPNTIAFKVRVNGTPSGSSVSAFNYDTVTVGAFGDVRVGWTLLISQTDNINAAYFRGRVRVAPSATVLYINRTSLAISDNDYVWVIKDVSLQAKFPWDANNDTVYNFDDDATYRQLLPMIYGLQTAIGAKPTSGNWDFALAPTGLATTSGATIASWAWVADGGTFQAGSAVTQNVTLRYTVAGVYRPRVTVTDSAGRTNWFELMICCIPDNYGSPVALGVTNISIEGSLDDGWNASIDVQDDTTFASVLDQTQITIFGFERYGATTTPILSNCKFVGRLRSTRTQMRATKLNGIVSPGSYEVFGIASQLGELRLPSLEIRRDQTPTLMGDVKDLTLWRAMALLMTEMITLSNIHSISFEDTTTNYAIKKVGTQNRRSAGDSLDDIAWYNNSILNYAPTGEIYIARHTNYLTTAERNARLVAGNFTSQDRNGTISLSEDFYRKIGALSAYGGTYNTSTDGVLALRAVAPSQVPDVGEGEQTINGQVLKSNLTVTQARTEIALRAGADFAAKNPVLKVSTSHSGGYHFLIPNAFQRWSLLVDAADNQAGIALTATDYLILEKVSINFNVGQALASVTAEWKAEAQSIPAKVLSEIEPELAPFDIPVLPDFPPYDLDFFDWDPLDNYVDNLPPDEEDEQPATNGGLTNNPKSPAAAKDRENKKPQVGCEMEMVNMRNSSTVNTAYTLTNAKNYTLTARGFGQISPYSRWYREYDFTASISGWSVVNGTDGGARGAYTGGTGFTKIFDYASLGNSETRTYLNIGSVDVTRIEVDYNTSTGGSYNVYYQTVAESGSSAGATGATALSGSLSTGLNTFAADVSFNTQGRIRIDFDYFGGNVTLTIRKVRLYGTGSAPSGATPEAEAYYADSFYTWTLTTAPIANPLVGLRVEGLAPAAQPYNPTHVYEIAHVGDGSTLGLGFADTNYNDNANALIYVQVCATDGSGVP